MIVACTIVQSSFLSTNSSSQWMATLYDRLVATLLAASLSTTALTTFLIGYRIHKVACMSGSRSKHRLGHIVKMIVESAAVYSLTLIVFSIVVMIQTVGGPLRSSPSGYPEELASIYLQAIAAIVSVCASHW